MTSPALRRSLHQGHRPNDSEKRVIRRELSTRVVRRFVSPIQQRHAKKLLQETNYRTCNWDNIRSYLLKPMANKSYQALTYSRKMV